MNPISPPEDSEPVTGAARGYPADWVRCPLGHPTIEWDGHRALLPCGCDMRLAGREAADRYYVCVTRDALEALAEDLEQELDQ